MCSLCTSIRRTHNCLFTDLKFSDHYYFQTTPTANPLTIRKCNFFVSINRCIESQTVDTICFIEDSAIGNKTGTSPILEKRKTEVHTQLT